MFPAIVSLSAVAHVAAMVFLPEGAPPPSTQRPTSEVVLVEQPLPPPPPPPPPVPAVPEPPAVRETPRAAEPPRPATRAMVTETAARADDVKIDADVGATSSVPPAPAPVASAVVPPVVAAAPPPPPPPPAPVLVPSKSLGRLPRAPALDRELERNYPAAAKQAGVAGTAMLRVQVLADGRLGKVERLAESYLGFGEACERTVRAARWDPPLDRDGRAVGTEIKYACRFEVKR